MPVPSKSLSKEDEEAIANLDVGYEPGDRARFEYAYGDGGMVFSSWADMDRIKNMKVYEDDVWLVTPPKCGTTWVQEIMWYIRTDVDDAKAEKNQFYRFPFLELQDLMGRSDGSPYPHGQPEDEEHVRLYMAHSTAYTEAKERPRLIKTHLPLSMLPDRLLDTCKVVFVARNVKDAAVSYMHHLSLRNPTLLEKKKEFFRQFRGGLMRYSPFLPIMLEAWEKKDHPNLHFMTYEGLHRNFDAELDGLMDFMGERISESKRDLLKEKVKIDSFRQNNYVNKAREIEHDPKGEKTFIRKGVVGDWKNHFDQETNEEWDKWIEAATKDTGFKMTFELE